MDRSCVLTLIGDSYQKDSINQVISAPVRREVFGNVSSVTASEWFAAGQQGMNAKYRVTVFAPDYQGETLAELDGVVYSIYRTYLARHEMIELYLRKEAGNSVQQQNKP